ncbi:unnamed protein product [Brassica rapa subsp. trilocularis]
MKQNQFKINKKDHNHLDAHLGDSDPGNRVSTRWS